MLNDRRRLWTSIIFIGLFAPFVVLLALNYLTGHKSLAPVAGATASAAVPAGSAPAATHAATAPAPTDIEDYPLLVAGDGRELWLVHPVEGENKERGFELLRRSPNTGVWVASRRTNASGGTLPYWATQTMPRALAVMQTPTDHPGVSTPYVFGDAKSEIPGAADPVGWVTSYTLDGDLPKDPLPRGHNIKAAVGSVDQLFVITLGPQIPSATQPGQPLHANTLVAPVRPVEAPATSAATTSEPSATASAPAPSPAVPLMFNAYWFPPSPPTSRPASMPADALLPPHGEWCLLAPLGPPADNPASLPKSSSHLALAEQDGQLIVFWADAANPSAIMFRTLDYSRPQQRWSAPRAVRLDEEFPSETRLFAVMLDQTIYLLWTVPTGNSRAIHGGWVDVRAAGDPIFHALPHMPLDSAGTGLVANDIAIGPSENSIVALVNNHEDGLKSITFDNQGRPLSPALAVSVETPGHDVQVGQNIAMVLLALMMVLALWQWRQKQTPLTLPPGMAIAPLHLRALAFGIDAVLPYAAVLLITHNTANGYFAMALSWVALLSNPEELIKSMDLLMFLGIYLGHVAIGELIFRRSLGKSMVGLQVMGTDGKAASIKGILLRNLLRLPECLVGVAALYVLISERHQRLGDLLGRTVVVVPQSSETPESPDKKKE